MNEWFARAFSDPYTFWVYVGSPVLQIAVLSVALYWVILGIERISAGGKLKGLALLLGVIIVFALVARLANLHAINWLLQTSISLSAIVLAVVFQPELRRFLTQVGARIGSADTTTQARAVGELVEALEQMEKQHLGALVVIERGDKLDAYIASSPLACDLTVKSLTALFWKDSPLHDGAVIVRDGRVSAAGVVLPLTENADYAGLSGTRHRAAIGISEDTDALALVLSEETGMMSLAVAGRLERGLTRHALEGRLNELLGVRQRRSTMSGDGASRGQTAAIKKPKTEILAPLEDGAGALPTAPRRDSTSAGGQQP